MIFRTSLPPFLQSFCSNVNCRKCLLIGWWNLQPFLEIFASQKFLAGSRKLRCKMFWNLVQENDKEMCRERSGETILLIPNDD